MKKTNFKIVIFTIVAMLIMPNSVLAHPGRTDSSGCHKCNGENTNCAEWGLNDGEYHCHSGNTYSNSKGEVFDKSGTKISGGSESNNNSSNDQSINNSNENNIPSNQTQTNNSSNIEKKKSNDTSISELSINDKKFYSVSDTLGHTVSTNKVDILVVTKDKNAKYEIQGNIDDLSKENVNEIKILVTAEDGTQKTFILNITREVKESYVRITSLNVNGNSIYFGIENTKELYLSNDEDKLNIEYKLSNTDANLFITLNGKEVKNGDYIEVGKNNYLLTISDEDGNEYSYELIIERMTKSDETISFIIGLITIGGIGAGIYYYKKKKK